MTSIHQIQNGDRVTGTYCGASYTGTVREQRPHTMNHHIQLFFVDLDAPQTILGLERDSLVINASDDFGALNRFLCGTADHDAIVKEGGR
jgi:hypothetical protein